MQLKLDGFTEAEVMQLLLTGLEARRGAVQAHIQDLQARISGKASGSTFVGKWKATVVDPAPSAKKRHKISAEGRQRIAEGQRKRWKATREKAKGKRRPRINLIPAEESAAQSE